MSITINDLPDDTIRVILSFCTTRSILNVGQTSKLFQSIVDGDETWFAFMTNQYPWMLSAQRKELSLKSLYKQCMASGFALRGGNFSFSEVHRFTERTYNVQAVENYLVCCPNNHDTCVLRRDGDKYDLLHDIAFGNGSANVYDTYTRRIGDRLTCLAVANDGSCQLVDVESANVIHSYDHSSGALLFGAFLDDQHAYSIGFDKTVQMLDLESQRIVRSFETPGNGLSVRSDNEHLVMAGASDCVCLFDKRKGSSPVREVQLDCGYVWRIGADFHAMDCVATGFNGQLFICDMRQGSVLDRLADLGELRGLWCDRSVILAGNSSGEVIAFDRKSNDLKQQLWRLSPPGHSGIICGLDVHAGRLYTVGWDQILMQWTANTDSQS